MTIEPHAGNHDIAIPQQQPAQDMVVPVNPLVEWAHAAREAHSIAESLARTSFVPRSLQGKPGDITAAILTGTELGMQPMAALRSLDIIQGTPALRAHAMRALVQSHGHQVQLVGEATPDKCVMRGRRKGEGEDDWQTVTWTIGRARDLGLAGKDQWKKQPQTMLIARATGEICRLIAADVLHGVPYTSEELTDHRAEERQQPSVTLADIHARGQEQTGASAPAPVPAPQQPQEFGEFEPFDSGEPAATPEQIGEIQRGAPEAGFGSPRELLEFAASEMALAVDRLEDLSATEAKALIDRLRTLAANAA